MDGKVGALVIGSKGAVATTLLAAHCSLRLGTDLGFRVPSEVEPAYKSLGLVDLRDVVFGGWDIVPDTYAESCRVHKVVPKELISQIAQLIDATDTYPAILAERDATIEKILESRASQPRMQDIEFATTVFTRRPLAELVRSLEYDIEAFRTKHHLTRLIVVNLSSTEPTVPRTEVHASLAAFEDGLRANNPGITSGMLYAYTAIKNGCHFINFTPSLTVDIPALVEFAQARRVVVTGKDGKTGQTLYKTSIAPLLKHRALKLTGWYSTNILGNRDGQVLHDPAHRDSKVRSKTSVLGKILGYDDFDHQVHIHYYLPRGDSKEAWDNIDFTGWFDVPMQMKIDWLGDDSILAAPLVADLIRWVDFFAGKGEVGVLPQLASYFKQPMGTDECDFFEQVRMLKTHVMKHYLTPGEQT
ncbi:MAG: inositol-3-phosphate synthase [Candidatus Tectomicrobia bacterium]|nr:inositol-3-phosphate synthase [Candidatus Tectomicrobia bacterium]